MKRQKKTYPLIKQIKPILWKECRFCGKEFRWENGFRIEDYTKINASLYWSYCCSECCNDMESVKDKIMSTDIRHQINLRGRATGRFKGDKELAKNHIERKGVSTSQLITFVRDTTEFNNQLKDCKCGGKPQFNGRLDRHAQIKCTKCDLIVGGMSTTEGLITLWNEDYAK